MTGTDPEATLRDAFTMFDNDKTGFIDEAYFKELLTSAGDEFTKDEIKQTWKEAPIEGGKLDYHKFEHTSNVVKRRRNKSRDLDSIYDVISPFGLIFSIFYENGVHLNQSTFHPFKISPIHPLC